MLVHESNYAQQIMRAVTYIEANLGEKLSLEKVAEEACISTYHFHRIFKSVTGETTKTFIDRIRLERAAQLLINTTEPIGDIALKIGYENHETFSRAFKRLFQLSPLEYRQTGSQLQLEKREAYLRAHTDLLSFNTTEPLIKYLPDMHVAYVRHIGSYDQVGASFQKLMVRAGMRFALKLKPVTLGIVHDNPDLTLENTIRFDACVVLNKPIRSTEKYSYKMISGGKYVVFRYTGPYDNFYQVYDYIYAVSIYEKGWELDDKPALEWYIKSPPFNRPDQYVTDFYVPVK